MRLLLLALACALLALATAAPAAEAGMHVGAEVCFEAIPLDCLGACADTPLSPPDFCPRISVPL